MYNVASKILCGAVCVLAAASCGDKERDAAMQLGNAAEKEVKEGNYETAIMILDTLDTNYASQVEVRRSAMKFRAMAVEGLTIKRISVVDDTLALLKQHLDEFETRFDYVENPGKGLGGNFVAKSIVKQSLDVLPRINDDGYFTLSVTVHNRSIGFERVVFSVGDEAASTLPVSASKLVKVENLEMTVLQQEDVADAMDWLVTHPEVKTYELVGSKATISQKLSPVLRNAIVETWQYALDRQAYRMALIEREKLERKLQLSRDQLANVIEE